MSLTVNHLLSAGFAYLVGSIPFSLLIARIFGGMDLRKHGSGNVGATNVARTMGGKWGGVALLCDAAKGMLAVGLLPSLLIVSEGNLGHQQVIAATLAVLGHMFPVWLGFRGGKGVATALGAVIILAPWSTLVAFVCFVIAFACSRIASLASIVASVSFAVIQFSILRNSLWSDRDWSLSFFSIAVPILILYQHRTNILRLLQGTEPQLSLGKSRKQESTAPPTES